MSWWDFFGPNVSECTDENRCIDGYCAICDAAPSPPPQPATTRLAAEADDLEQRYVAQRERAERAEAGVAELTRRIEKMERDHALAVGELAGLLEHNADIVTARRAIDRLFAMYGDSLQRMSS